MSSIEERKKTIEANNKLIEDTLAKLKDNRERYEGPFRAAGIDPADVTDFTKKSRIPAHVQQHVDRAIERDMADLEQRRQQARKAARAEQGDHHKVRHPHSMV